jgi:hypothetical protein
MYQELPKIYGTQQKHEAELKFAHARIEDIEKRIERHSTKIDKVEDTGSHMIIEGLQKKNARYDDLTWKIIGVALVVLLGTGVLAIVKNGHP